MSEGIYNKYSGYHNRKSIRLKGYDYSRPGYYFVTICIHDRKQKMFGDVVNGKMVLNDAGEYVRQCWLDIPMHFPHIKLDEYVVIPNHVHGIIIICDLSGGVTGGVTGGVIVGANNYSPLLITKSTSTKTNAQHRTILWNVKNHRFHCAWFQNRCYEMVSSNDARRDCVATQLLRPHYP